MVIETIWYFFKVQLPDYLESLPLPSSVAESYTLTYNQWLQLVPFISFFIYIAFSPFINFLINTQLRKRHQHPRINRNQQQSEIKVVNTFDIENLGNKTLFCRCWCSKTFPYCDGSHDAHNKETGDNVGPLTITYTHKILVIGETGSGKTGSGKTSFLNLLCNSSLVQAQGFPEVLAQFRQLNDIKLEKARSTSHEMETKTKDAKLYNVELGDLKLGVIDTPGFGDTRGLKEDKTNMMRIIDLLREEEYINCVCLIIDGRQCRMSATLRYVLTEMTSSLPIQVLENVIVVFTNTADPLDLNFDADSLQEYFGREIDGQRIFFIENPYCRFEKALKQKGKLPEEELAQSLKRAFEETHDVLTEMCHTVKKLPQVLTSHFTTLYLKKEEVDEKVAALLTAHSETELESRIAEAEEEASGTKTLNNKFRSTQTIEKWSVVTTSDHNTLCGAANCYSNCHVPCHELSMSFDKEIFRSCYCMSGSYCKACGHHYAQHYHSQVRWERQYHTREFVDEAMKKKFEDAKTMEERALIFIKKLKEDREESEQERKRLSKCLLSAIAEFQELAINRSYAKCLENQLAVVEQRLMGTTYWPTNSRSQESKTRD